MLGVIGIIAFASDGQGTKLSVAYCLALPASQSPHTGYQSQRNMFKLHNVVHCFAAFVLLFAINDQGCACLLQLDAWYVLLFPTKCARSMDV